MAYHEGHANTVPLRSNYNGGDVRPGSDIFKATGYLRRFLSYRVPMNSGRISLLQQKDPPTSRSIRGVHWANAQAIECRPGEYRYLLMLAELLKLNGELTQASLSPMTRSHHQRIKTVSV